MLYNVSMNLINTQRLCDISLVCGCLCRWIEVCIEDELPPTTELEEALRNGVILGRLGHYYAPEILPLRKIYDRDQAKYRVSCLKEVCSLCEN